MATRFYFPSTGAATVTPAFGSGWGTTTNATRLKAVKTRISSAMAFVDGVGTVATDNQLLRQFIYEAETLSAQTFGGTVKGQARMSGSNTSIGCLALRIAAVSPDGSSVTEILGIVSSSDSTTPPFENADNSNRRFETGSNTFSITVPAVGVTAGHYLFFEVGYRDQSANGTRFASIIFGDNSGTDLAEDETTTTANNPWLEFTMDIAFGGGSSARAHLTGGKLVGGLLTRGLVN